jgi:hypothetical protein
MKTLFSLIICGFFVGCGNSPISNHRDQQNHAETEDESADSNKCQLNATALGLCAQFKFTADDMTAGSLRFYDVTNPIETRSIAPWNLRVYLWMPSMGHGSSPVELEQDISQPGLFNIRRIQFIMPGEWEIHFVLGLEGQKDEHLVLKVRVS